MNKVVTKLFIKHWRIWLAVTPIFIISGIVFGTAIVLLSALSSADASSGVDYGVFLQVPIVIGGVILCLFTNNAMKQCIDFFDDTAYARCITNTAEFFDDWTNATDRYYRC